MSTSCGSFFVGVGFIPILISGLGYHRQCMVGFIPILISGWVITASLARYLSLAKAQKTQRGRHSLGEEVQANAIRLQGAALVAVRKKHMPLWPSANIFLFKLLRTATRAAPCSRQTPRVEWIPHSLGEVDFPITPG